MNLATTRIDNTAPLRQKKRKIEDMGKTSTVSGRVEEVISREIEQRGQEIEQRDRIRGNVAYNVFSH